LSQNENFLWNEVSVVNKNPAEGKTAILVEICETQNMVTSKFPQFRLSRLSATAVMTVCS
jgi:hypothetical protein